MNDQTLCPKCNSPRSNDLREPCGACSARKTLFGYLYPHENQGCVVATSIIFAVIFLIVIGFIVFVVILRVKLAEPVTNIQLPISLLCHIQELGGLL